MKNKESGVTLIVLVISIIVLLLIAGITINMAAKQVGIFKPKTHQGISVVVTNKVNTTNTTNTTISSNKVPVQIIVNNRIVADYSKDKGENVEFELKGTGSQDVKIKINGTTRLTRKFNIEDVSESVIID